jgi:hypothetical protein
MQCLASRLLGGFSRGFGARVRSISRSSYDTFSKCPRKGYWTYLFQGTGVVPRIPDWPLVIGSAVHAGMEHLMRLSQEEESVEGAVGFAQQALNKAFQPVRFMFEDDPLLAARFRESSFLVEALLRGWVRARAASFFQDYDILSIEVETPVLLSPGLTLNARVDVVVRSRSDGQVYVFNWKTSSSKKLDKWDHDIQMWTEAVATEGTIGEEIAGCIVEVLYKGQRRYGLQLSPLLYAYVTKNGDIRHEWSAGSTRLPVWEMPGGVKRWVEETLPLEVVSAQFLRTPPLPKNNDVVHDWLEQVVYKERVATHVLKEGSERERELHFDQRFSDDNCPWCPFRRVCGKATTIQTLLEEGVLIPRVDHHAIQ